MNRKSTPVWAKYIAQLMGNENQAAFAKRTGQPEATISRWINGDSSPRAESVIQFARDNNLDPLYSLFQAGYLTAQEIEDKTIPPRFAYLKEFTDLELAQEMLRRVEDGNSNVTPLRPGMEFDYEEQDYAAHPIVDDPDPEFP